MGESRDEQVVLAGRYLVGDPIGHGGMATVHQGRDLRLGRTVAIKLLRSDLARDPSFHSRFRREAQAAAGLNAPSVVAVYDTGEDEIDGEPVPYIVM
jgi:serine/threonine protein kinase